MKIQLYDPALCCSSGVCGPAVDPALPAVAAFLRQALALGANVERFNLGQQPAAYAANPVVKDLLEREGVAGLPALLVDGELVLHGGYPGPTLRQKWLDCLQAAAPGQAS